MRPCAHAHDHTTTRPSEPARTPLLEGLHTLFLDGRFFAMLTPLFGVGLAIQYRAPRSAVALGRVAGVVVPSFC